ncbi:MAG: hypothetical protein ACOC4M_14115 [Promethearchaeia archaeon]
MSENSENKDDEKTLIDPDVEEELDQPMPEQMITEYGTKNAQNTGNEKNQIASEWIGQSEDWKVKTKLSSDQIIAMSQLRMMPQIFDELEEIEEDINEIVSLVEKYSVSHHGLSRQQHTSVLKSMFSGETEEEQKTRNAVLQAFAASENSDE